MGVSADRGIAAGVIMMVDLTVPYSSARLALEHERPAAQIEYCGLMSCTSTKEDDQKKCYTIPKQNPCQESENKPQPFAP